MSFPRENEEQTKVTRPQSRDVWMRGLVMLVIAFCLGFAQSLLFVLAVVQFLWMLITGERNMLIADFGRSLGLWQAECAWFLSADSEERPFPWRPWPRG